MHYVKARPPVFIFHVMKLLCTPCSHLVISPRFYHLIKLQLENDYTLFSYLYIHWLNVTTYYLYCITKICVLHAGMRISQNMNISITLIDVGVSVKYQHISLHGLRWREGVALCCKVVVTGLIGIQLYLFWRTMFEEMLAASPTIMHFYWTKPCWHLDWLCRAELIIIIIIIISSQTIFLLYLNFELSALCHSSSCSLSLVLGSTGGNTVIEVRVKFSE